MNSVLNPIGNQRKTSKVRWEEINRQFRKIKIYLEENMLPMDRYQPIKRTLGGGRTVPWHETSSALRYLQVSSKVRVIQWGISVARRDEFILNLFVE